MGERLPSNMPEQTNTAPAGDVGLLDGTAECGRPEVGLMRGFISKMVFPRRVPEEPKRYGKYEKQTLKRLRYGGDDAWVLSSGQEPIYEKDQISQRQFLI